MRRACKTIHRIEYTDAEGVRRFVESGVIVEEGVIPANELVELVRLKAVTLFDPLDRDRDGRAGGSKRGRRRKASGPATAEDSVSPPVVETVEPETADEPTFVEHVEEGPFD